LWPAASVNAVLSPMPAGDGAIPASKWLDQNLHVEQMTWAPGMDMIIEDRLVVDGGWIKQEGANCFNLYLPPTLELGDPNRANRWIGHVWRVYPNDADHIIKWLAHRVQHPHIKVNHALVLGGEQGIGKDTILEPVKYAVGPWNFVEVSPTQMMGRFNGFAKSVILRVSEARDLGDVDRFAFYDHTKVFCAAPPDVLRVDEKNLPEHAVFKVCGMILTSNHKTDGIYLPADDRRHFVAWSDITKDEFPPKYWDGLYAWYNSGGIENVVAYLAALDLSAFDPKAPPPKTAAFWAIVDANQSPEDAELADILDILGNPDAVIIPELVAAANGDMALWLKDRKNRRAIGHRLDACGYASVRNDKAIDGLWVVRTKRQVICQEKHGVARSFQGRSAPRGSVKSLKSVVFLLCSRQRTERGDLIYKKPARTRETLKKIGNH
jgi:hypothetical protein